VEYVNQRAGIATPVAIMQDVEQLGARQFFAALDFRSNDGSVHSENLICLRAGEYGSIATGKAAVTMIGMSECICSLKTKIDDERFLA
jgi:hypothetical protein